MLHSVTLRYIAMKSEFINSFVSLITLRNNRNIFACAGKSNYTALFKDNKNNKAPRSADREGIVQNVK